MARQQQRVYAAFSASPQIRLAVAGDADSGISEVPADTKQGADDDDI
jgi:hypothetical protein